MALKLSFFLVLSIPVFIISFRSILKPMSHGFYRFFSWECILFLIVTNAQFWFKNPIDITQIFSWIFLLTSGYMVIAGFFIMKKFGKAEKKRNDSTLHAFEKTTQLLEKGIFRYIRHPLYSSLLFLTWGVFLKNPDFILFIIALASSAFLFLTAKTEEIENISFFGKPYQDYKNRTKMFVPYII